MSTAAAAPLTELQALESESIHIIREVAATFASPVMLFSGGKDSVVMLHLAAKAFWPAPIPFGVLHVDTGHNFPEVLEFRDQAVRVLRRPAQGRRGPGLHRRRPAAGATGRHPQPAADRAAARRHHRAASTTRCSAAAAGTRSAPGPRSGSSACATSSASGSRGTSGPSSGRSTTAGTCRVSTSGCSRCPTGPSSTSGTTSRPRRSPCPRSTTRTNARSSLRDGMWIAITPVTPVRDGEVVELRSVRYRTVGDMSCTAAVLSDRQHRARRDHRGRTQPAHRARRHPGRRPAVGGRDGGPQAGGLLLMAVVRPRHRRGDHRRRGRTLLRLATAGSVDDGKSTLVGRLLFDTNSVLSDTLDHVEKVSKRKGLDRADLALLTDGLRAEREQGITIDVAYRYFATPARKFILADCPGTRAVHPEHRHRFLDRRRDRAAGRRPQRRDRADPPASGRRLAAAGPARGAGGEQDRPGRLRRGRVLEGGHRLRPAGPQPRGRSTPTASRCRRPRATTW